MLFLYDIAIAKIGDSVSLLLTTPMVKSILRSIPTDAKQKNVTDNILAIRKVFLRLTS